MNKCLDICGDGFNYDLSCDDKNNNENDGCFSNCTIDPRYKCDVNLTSVYCS